MGSGIHHRCDERSKDLRGSHRGQDQIGIHRDVLGASPGHAPTAARGPQGSHKPHHNSRERALRGERSGGSRDESHRRAICQIAGLDESERRPNVGNRAAIASSLRSRRSA